MINVLVLGQTPPPFGGQAVMIERLLRMSSPEVRLHHVRMDFSRDMDEIGKVRLKKLFHLGSLVFRTWFARVRTGSDILYYPPAGPHRVPMYRDIAILLLIRWMFRRTVFHFHAGGVSGLYANLAWPMRWIFRRAYFRPAASIRISDLNPEDGKVFRSRSEFVIPNGMEDASIGVGPVEKPGGPTARILFIGILCESKGLLVLLEACRILRSRGVPFILEAMGKFESPGFEKQSKEKIAADGTGGSVRFLGVLTGNEKFRAIGRSDIFCFPTHFESESFGLVLLEAMCMGLPLVATRWRGVPSIVRDGENGYLVPIQDPVALAGRLETLIADPALRESMGRKGRERFEREYGLEGFHRNMVKVFKSVHD